MLNEDELKLQLLQLQRSALIDTQTCMQLLIDKGICTLDDIFDARARIETENPDVIRLNAEIEKLGGNIPETDSSAVSKKSEIQDQLKELQNLLSQMTKNSKP